MHLYIADFFSELTDMFDIFSVHLLHVYVVSVLIRSRLIHRQVVSSPTPSIRGFWSSVNYVHCPRIVHLTLISVWTDRSGPPTFIEDDLENWVDATSTPTAGNVIHF